MTQTKVVPDGMHSVTPQLVCGGAVDAIEFYKKLLPPRKSCGCRDRAAN